MPYLQYLFFYLLQCICRASLQNVAHGIATGCLPTTGSTVSLLSYFLSAYGNAVDSSGVSVSRRSGCADGDDDSSHSPTILNAADERQLCQTQYCSSWCALVQCHWFSLYAALLGASLFLLFLVASSKNMYRILKSYHKKAERKHQVTCDAPPTAYRQSEVSGNGTVIPAVHSWKPTAGGGYSESSSYETHAHYERKIQRVKKTRGDRDRSSHRRSGDKRLLKVSEPWSLNRSGETSSAKEGLLQWAQQVTQGYPGVNLVNFTTSWNDGLAFCAIMHHYRPSLISWRDVRRRMSPRERLETAFRLADNEFGVTKLLDPEDVDVELPDEKSVMTYVSSLYDALESADAEQYDHEFNQYCTQAHSLYNWIKRQIENYTDQGGFLSSADSKKELMEIERFRAEELPSKSRDKQNLSHLYSRLEELFEDTDLIGRAAPPYQEISHLWDQLMDAVSVRERALHGEQSGAGSPAFLQNLEHQIGEMNEALDGVLRRIEDTTERSATLSAAELQALLNGIVNDLNELEAPIEDLFAQTEALLSSGYPGAHKVRMQAFGLHQRRIAYLQRCNAHLLLEPDVRGEYVSRLEQDRYAQTKEDVFSVVKQCIEWVERRLVELSEMKFKESLPFLEELLENHKVDHREIIDFHYQVDQCIARQSEISAPDTDDYWNHLVTLEKEYYQLRELSTGRMLDLDSLIAFIRAAQLELVWISEREEVEISRNWADVDQLDLPMLQNYYKQLMHEIELREAPFNVVHDQGAALVNQRHPAVDVIDLYLTTMQSQWDWLLGLTQCLDAHLHDALSLREFLDEAGACERWIELQLQTLEAESSKGTLKMDDGDRLLEQLDEMRECMDKYLYMLASLAERSRTISPLWQRAEPILMQIPVTALCNYVKKEAVIRKGDLCTLLDNSESLTTWSVRTEEGTLCDAPSVIFRIPPPDERIVAYCQRLQSMFDRLRRNWQELYTSARYAMLTRAMREICGWDLKEFLTLDPETRDNIIRALNEDVNRFLDELDKGDPMAVQLRDELNATNDHFYKLLQQAMREPDADIGEGFDRKATQLIQDLEDAWRLLNQRVSNAIPKTVDKLELLIDEHKTFEDDLQARDSEISMVQELFRQLNTPSPLQRSLLDQVLNRWEDLWDMSKMYAERLKAVEVVLGSIAEATEIVLAHEKTLGSCDTMPAVLDKLRSLHAELLEIQLVLQQQQPVFQDLASNVVKMRQYVARTRPNVADHFDVDRAEEVVQRLTVRWENICTQVIERLKFTELAIPILLVYRGAYEDEMAWLDRVEETINNLRSADSLEPDEHQEQLDLLMAEYANLNERTVAVEKVNREGGRFIREAKLYDLRTGQYRTFLTDPQLTFGPLSAVSGVQQVSKELDELNRRFSQLASVILERRNVIQVLMQNYRRKKEVTVRDALDACKGEIESLSGRLKQWRNEVAGLAPQELTSDENVLAAAERITVIKSYVEGILPAIRDLENKITEYTSISVEFLTPAEFQSLLQCRDGLLEMYDSFQQCILIIIDRLRTVIELGSATASSIVEFRQWLDKIEKSLSSAIGNFNEPSTLESSRLSAEALEAEIGSQKTLLATIKGLEDQLTANINDCLIEFNILRRSAEPPLPSVEYRNSSDSQSSKLADAYMSVLQRVLDFKWKVSQATYINDNFAEMSDRIERSLDLAEESARSTQSFEAPGMNVQSLRDCMHELQNTSDELVHQKFFLTELRRNAKEYVLLVGNDAITTELNSSIERLDRRLRNVEEEFAKKRSVLQDKLCTSESLEIKKNDFEDWLYEVESKNTLRALLPLQREELRALLEDQRLLLADIARHQQTLSSLTTEAPGVDTVTSAQLSQLQQRLRNAHEDAVLYCEHVQTVFDTVDNFVKQFDLITVHLSSMMEELSSIEFLDEEMDPYAVRLQIIREAHGELRDDVAMMRTLLGEMQTFPNKSDADFQTCQTKMQDAQELWKKADRRLAELEESLARRKAMLNEYEQVTVNFSQSLTEAEHRFASIGQVALLENALDRQLEDVRFMSSAHSLLRTDLNAVEAVSMPVSDSHYTDSPASSFVASKTKELCERYESLGRSLREREASILAIRGSLSSNKLLYDDLMSSLRRLSEQAEQFNFPSSPGELERCDREVKELGQKLAELSARLVDYETDCAQLIDAAKDLYDCQSLRNKAQDLGTLRHHTLEKVEQLGAAVKELGEFFSCCASFETWLNTKEKCVELIAPVPTDAQEIESQLTFVDALREEFNTQASALCNMRAMGQKVLLRSEAMLNKKCLAVEEKMASCTSRWEQLLALINDRSKRLVDSKKISSRLFLSLGSMQTSLNCIMLAVGSYTASSAGKDLEGLTNLKSKLEEHARELLELEDQAQQFCSLCDNPVVLVDIQSKLASLRQLSEEIDRKINSLQVAAENKIAERSELEKKTSHLLDWAGDVRERLNGFQEISADPSRLQPMCGQLDALYEEVLAHEGEVSWLLSEAKADCLSDEQLCVKYNSLAAVWQELLSATKRKKAELSAVTELQKQLTMTWDNFQRKQENVELQLAKCKTDASTADLGIAETLKVELNEISASLASALADRDAANVLVSKLRERTSDGADALSESVGPHKDRLALLNDTWRNLHAMVDLRQKMLQERAASLVDSQTCLRGLTDSFSSCCALSDTRDRARLEQLRDEVQQAIERNLGKIQALSASGAQADELAELQSVQTELVGLQTHLDERMSELENVVKQCDETRCTVDSLIADINQAEAALSGIDPRLRKPSGVDAALETVQSLLQVLQEKKGELSACEEQASELEAAGYAADAAQCRQRVSQCRATLESVILLTQDKGFKLESVKADLDDLLSEINQLYNGIEEMLSSDVLQIPLRIDLAERTSKTEELDVFRQTAEAMAEAVRKSLSKGNYLIKSAAPGADCSELESQLASLHNVTKELLSKISERAEKMETALRTAEAYQTLVNELSTWLTDTEELVANQRPPAFYYKVAKAQLREQMLLRKFLKDKQVQLDRLRILADEIFPCCNDDSFLEVTGQLEHLSERFSRLCDDEAGRTVLLKEVAEQSQLWHEVGTPLIGWIEDTQRRLNQLDYIAINEEKLTNQKSLIKEVLDDVASHHEDVGRALEIGQRLRAMLCDSEAPEMDKQLALLADGYDEISHSSVTLDEMMEKMSHCVSNFMEESGEIGRRLLDMEERLRSAKPVSVYADVLDRQTSIVMELGEEISKFEDCMSDIMEKGRLLCERTSGDEALAMQSELEALRMRYSSLNKETDQFLGVLEETVPLADTFHKAHASLSDWLLAIESDFIHMAELSMAQQIGLLKNIQEDIESFRHLFEEMNSAATKLSQLTSEDGASTIESMASRLNRRFDTVCDQMQRKSERLSIAQVEFAEIASVLDDLMDWFQKMEATLDNVLALSIDPAVAREQLRNQELAHADVMSQRSKAREASICAKRVMKVLSGSDRQSILDRVEALQELVDNVSEVSRSISARLGEAVPFTADFEESCATLEEWLTWAESELENLPVVFSGVQADQLKRQLDYTTNLQKEVMDQRLVVEKLNRSGAFIRGLLSAEDDMRVADTLEQMNLRFDHVKENVHLRLQTLDEALSESSQFTDKLDGMLDSLSLYADTMQALEPISSCPDRIRHQISDNLSFVHELERKNVAYEALLAAASDIISKASPEDAAGVENIRQKISLLQKLWDDVLKSAEMRGQNLQGTLAIAETFWVEYQNCLEALKELQRRVQGYDKPACEIEIIKVQQLELQEAEDELRKQEPRVTQCREIGQQLLDLVSNAEKPEIRQKIDELDVVYETVTEAFARRGHDLIDAMERTMSFYEKLQKVNDFMVEAEDYAAGFHTVSADPVSLQEQLVEVGRFKEKLDENAIDLEQLNQLAMVLAEGTSPGQSSSVQATVDAASKRWEVLSTSVVERQHKLEKALLQMGHFNQAISQLIDWIERTEGTIRDVGAFPGDPNRNEIESAKLKVIQNDLLAHQISVDTLNSTVRKTDDSSKELHDKLENLNFKWSALHRLFDEKVQQLETCKQESDTITDQVNEYLSWITDVDNSIFGNRSFGGLPDSAQDQLNRFMVTYEEVLDAKSKISDLLVEGDQYLKSSCNGAPFANLLKAFRQRWEGLLQKVSDRKIKLELALQEATEFDKLMTHFLDWLTQAEDHLNSQEPVSRLKERLVSQMQQHQAFQEEVDACREKAHELDKRGTKIKYTCQRQDATTIKNLLATTMSRWNKVLNRTADRAKLLDSALCETQSFMDQWYDLNNWCSQSITLVRDESGSVPNNVDKIKEALASNAEFRQLLLARQADFDAVNRLGKRLKNHGIRDEEKVLDGMLVSLRDQWNDLFALANERQQKLEEALLFSGQFKEAVATLMDYLVGAEERLDPNASVYGDLDSVLNWEEDHKTFMNHLNSRQSNVETIRQAAKELIGDDSETNAEIRQQVELLEQKWARVNELSQMRESSLAESRKIAERFHHDAHALLELLTDLESRAKELGGMPEQECELQYRVDSFDQLAAELRLREPDLSDALAMGADIVSRCHPSNVQPMQRWLSLLRSRWGETDLLLTQRTQRLKDQLLSIQEQDILLDDLIDWMLTKEKKLNEDRRAEVPLSVEQIEQLIREHELFENELRQRQPDVDEVTKGHRRVEAEQVKELMTPRRPVRSSTSSTAKAKVHHRKKNTKVQLVADKWRELWLQSMERNKRLGDALEFAKEARRLENFSFDDWRTRYLTWINHKKSRVMDFFRRQDKDCDGRVTRDEFIDGILASKFPTSRLEMNYVADIFDRNNEGFIDYMEFIDALRPDREPVTEAEKIKDEVKRQTELCTCTQKYRIKEVGDGKYKFGEQVRLVRILRSTVMVRVGGGWVSLCEYLLRYDPCRTKGRTNIELREKFILPEGASQSMCYFKAKGSRGQVQTGTRYSTAHGEVEQSTVLGPIVKIREKTERSMPMRSLHRVDDNSPGRLVYEVKRTPPSRLFKPPAAKDKPVAAAQASPLNGYQASSAPITTKAEPRTDSDPSIPASRPSSRASSDVSEMSSQSQDSSFQSRIPSIRKKKGERKK